MEMLTNKRKLEIYKSALKYYKKCVREGETTGLCNAINMVRAYNEPSPYVYYEMEINYPELFAYYPPDKNFSTDYWWDKRKRKIRIDILTNIINGLEGK